jgi:nicotinamidase/pyrazinamidase
MANVIFWDVDTQHDFIVHDGKLYIEGAEKLAHNLKDLTQFARERELVIVATVCDHTADDEEISEEPDFETTFPPHCMRNTPGQRKIPATAMKSPVVIPLEALKPEEIHDLVDDHDGEILIQKNHFDVFSNPNTGAVVDTLEPDHVVIYGVALDVCDRMAVEGFLKRGNVTVHLVTDAVQAIQPKRGQKLLKKWAEKGVRMVTTRQILEGALDPLL